MALHKKIRAGLLTLTAIPITIASIALLSEFRPEPVESLTPFLPPSLPDTPKDGFEILSWNLQFAGSRKHHFFYDGGNAVSVPKTDVDNTLNAIQNVIATTNPDILMLQEIDRNSKRTHNIDQLRYLLDMDPQWAWVSTPYYKSPYVPHPSHEHMGSVNMHLALMSKSRLSHSERIALPLLNEPRWRQYFNLKRAILTSKVFLPGQSQPVSLAVTHLSAFSHGDGTLEKQVAKLLEWIDARGSDEPWILAGDLNLLPPEDTPERLGEDQIYYSNKSNPILPLMKYNHAFPDKLSVASRTYLPFSAQFPDRKIDYVFYGGPLELIEASVLSQYSDISDHLPIKARFRLK